MTGPASLRPEQLLERVAWVRRLAATLVSEAADADDVAQETWRLALERPPRRPGRLEHWLAVAARNVARGLGRRERRHRELVERAANVARDAAAPSAADLVERAQLQRRLVGVLLELPEPYRSTLLERYFEERPPAEIALRSGVPVDTVKSRLKRGLERLRERLTRESAGGADAWRGALLPLVRWPAAGAPAAGATSTILGGMAMSKAAKVAAAVLLAAAAAVVARFAGGPGAVGAGEPSSVASAADPAAARTDADELAAPEAVREIAPAATAPAVDDAIAPQPGPGSTADPVAPALVEGVVRDELGEPVEGAFVMLGPAAGDDPGLRESLLRNSGYLRRRAPPAGGDGVVATTDPAGRFRIEGVSPFSGHSLAAHHPDHGSGFGGVFEPSPGERLEKDLVLEGGVVLHGRVVRSDGTAARDDVELHVFVFAADADEEASAGSGRPVGKLDVEEDGTFSLPPLPYRRFELVAEEEIRGRPEEHEGTSTGVIEIEPGVRSRAVEIRLLAIRRLCGPIVVAGGSLADLRAFADSRFERFAAHDGAQRVFTAGSIPVLRVHGTVAGAEGSQVDGRVDLAAGTWSLPLRPPGFDRIELSIGEQRLAEAAVVAGASEGPPLVVDASSLVDAEGRVRLTMLTFDSLDRRPIGDVFVRVEPAVAADGSADASIEAFIAPDSGRSELELAPGWISVVAAKEGYVSDRVEVDLSSGAAEQVTLGLTPLRGALRGRVLDEDGLGWSGARLAVYRLEDGGARRLEIEGAAREDGRFELERAPSPPFVLVASAPGEAPARLRVDRFEPDVPVVLQAEAPVAVVLHAQDPAGRDVNGVRWSVAGVDSVPLLDSSLPWMAGLDRARIECLLPRSEVVVFACASDGRGATVSALVREDCTIGVTLPVARR